MIANAKNKDALKDCEVAKGNSAKMWKAVNKAMNKKPNTNPDFVKTRDANGDIVRINCKNEIANVMNKQFTEMGSKLAEKLDTTEKLFSDYLKNATPKSFFIQAACEPETEKYINEADINKATGLDEIPAKLLKWAAALFASMLTKLFNKCIEEGVYPDSLKLARVTPVFKGGNKNKTTSYRRISILSQFSLNHIFEKLLRDRLFNSISYYNSLGSNPNTQLNSQKSTF